MMMMINILYNEVMKHHKSKAQCPDTDPIILSDVLSASNNICPQNRSNETFPTDLNEDSIQASYPPPVHQRRERTIDQNHMATPISVMKLTAGRIQG
jgi:hypothetical protein